MSKSVQYTVTKTRPRFLPLPPFPYFAYAPYKYSLVVTFIRFAEKPFSNKLGNL